MDKLSASNDVPKTTRSGCQVKTPTRILHLNKPAGPFTKRREVVRPNPITKEDHVTWATCTRELLDDVVTTGAS